MNKKACLVTAVLWGILGEFPLCWCTYPDGNYDNSSQRRPWSSSIPTLEEDMAAQQREAEERLLAIAAARHELNRRAQREALEQVQRKQKSECWEMVRYEPPPPSWFDHSITVLRGAWWVSSTVAVFAYRATHKVAQRLAKKYETYQGS